MRRRVQVGLVGLSVGVALILLAGCAPCSMLPIPGGGPQIQFWASQDVLQPGGCTLLHWQVSSGEQYPVFLDGKEVAAEGQEDVCPQQTETFELVVGAPSGSIRQTVTVQVEGEVQQPPPEEPGPGEQPPEEPGPGGGPEVINFIVDPDTIPQGGCAVLHWEVVPPDFEVTINGQGVAPVGEREECPQSTTVYELVVQAPGGPQQRSATLHVEGGGPGPEPTPQPPAQPTATQPPPAQPTATQPPPAQPTATTPPPTATPTTFVPVWGQCSWVKVEQAGINSHQKATWCSNGSFLTGLDLDRGAAGIDAMDSPVIGQAQCCPLSVAQFSPWGQCSWVGVEQAGINSHQPVAWCPNGQYLTGLDLDRIAGDPLDSPGVGQGFCCPFGDPNKYTTWGSCSWVKVEQGGINSHQPVTWCPNGSFIVGLDLDRGQAGIDALDSPVVGQAYCCSPK
jgi:uncharacterized Zn-binding protein involved in type VI secretion